MNSPTTPAERIQNDLMEVIRLHTRIHEISMGLLATIMALPDPSELRTLVLLDQAELREEILNLWLLENMTEEEVVRIIGRVGLDARAVKRIIDRAREAGDPRATYDPSSVAPHRSPLETSCTQGTHAPDQGVEGVVCKGPDPVEDSTTAAAPEDPTVGNEPEQVPLAAAVVSAEPRGEEEAATEPSPPARDPLPKGVRARGGRFRVEISYRGDTLHVGSCGTVEEAIAMRDTAIARRDAGLHPKGKSIIPDADAKATPEQTKPNEPSGFATGGVLHAPEKPVTLLDVRIQTESPSPVPMQRFNTFNTGEAPQPIEEPQEGNVPAPVAESDGQGPGDEATSHGDQDAEPDEPRRADPARSNLSAGRPLFVHQADHRVEGPAGRITVDYRLIPAFQHLSDGGTYRYADLAIAADMDLADFKPRLKVLEGLLERIGVRLQEPDGGRVRVQRA